MKFVLRELYAEDEDTMMLRNVDTATIRHSVTYQRTSETPPTA